MLSVLKSTIKIFHHQLLVYQGFQTDNSLPALDKLHIRYEYSGRSLGIYTEMINKNLSIQFVYSLLTVQ